MKFRVFLLMVLLLVQAPGLAAEARESHEEAIPVFVNSEPTNRVTDPPTCQLNNKNGLVHQVLCYGETFKIKATSSDENAAVQWFSQNNTGNWAAVAGATNVELTTGKGIYKAIFTFSDSSTCETSTDTIEYWKAFQIDWQVAACRAGIVGATALPFPQQLTGEGELSTPVDPQAEINYNWQVIPEPAQASFQTSSTSIFPLTDGFFQDTTLGLHQVVLTVSQYGSECVSVDTMEVTLLPLNVWADTLISYGGHPAIAVAHASGGTEPYQFTWSGVDTCLSSNCDSVRVSDFNQQVMLRVIDETGCLGNRFVNFGPIEEHINCNYDNCPSICNSSFETFTFPVDEGAIGKAIHWYEGGIFSTHNPTADLFVRDNPNSDFSIPENKYGYTNLENGNAYAGLVNFSNINNEDECSSLKEYLQMEFENPVPPGAYFGMFNHSKAKNYFLYRNDLGMFISRNPPKPRCLPTCDFHTYTLGVANSSDCSSEQIFPQVVADGEKMKNYNSWEKAIGFFTLSGEEKFVTIGGFRPKSNGEPIEIIHSGTTTPAEGKNDYSYYFIDDVALIRFPVAYQTEFANISNCQPIPLGYTCQEAEVAASGLQYYWYKGFYTETNPPPPGTYISTNLHFEAQFSGDYTLVVVSPAIGNQISIMEYSSVKVNNQTPVVSIIGPAFFCEGVSIEFTSVDNGITRLWNTGSNQQSITVTGAGTYTVTVTGVNGCTATASKTVEYFPISPQPVLSPISICEGRDVCGTPLVAAPSGGIWTTSSPVANVIRHFNINTLPPQNCNDGWFFNAADPEDETDEGLSPGTYPLQYTYTDANGCSSSAMMNGIIRPKIELNFSIQSAPFCPMKALSLQVLNPNPEVTYHWDVEGQLISFTGPIINNVIWENPGTYQITLWATNPNDPEFCNVSTTQRITITNPTVPISSKVLNSPIVVCSDISEITLQTVVSTGAYTWWMPPGTELAGFEDPAGSGVFNHVTAPLNPIIGNQPSFTEVNVSISPYMGCATATGTITITRTPNGFTGNPLVTYLDPVTQISSTSIPISLCSGHEVTLVPSGVTYVPLNQGDGFQYQWTGPTLSNPVFGSLTLSNLPPGSYTYRVQAVELQGGRCGGEFTDVVINVSEQGLPTITAIPIDDFPNDFRLRVSFDQNATMYLLVKAPNDFIFGTSTPGNQQDIAVYNHENQAGILEDGKYHVYTTYANGCVGSASFTVLGERGMGTSPEIYTQQSDLTGNNQPISGLAFIHHNVRFNSGDNAKTLWFQDAEVYVRGEVGPDENTVFGTSPGPVLGTKIVVNGSNSGLRLVNSTFSAVLDRMWGGIEVNGIRNLAIGPQNPNGSFNCQISDAYLGLEIGPAAIHHSSDVSGLRLTNCFRGLISRSSIANEGFSAVNRLTNSRVDCDPHEMKKPYQPRMINGVFRSFLTETGMNLTEDSHYPAVLDQSNNLVHRFRDNAFDNCINGLVVSLTNNNRRVEVFNCTFTNSLSNGIYAFQGLQNAANCTFSIPDRNSNLPANFHYSGDPGESVGIRGYNVGFAARGNTFAPTGNGTRPSIGIHSLLDEGLTRILNISGNTFTDLSTFISLERQGGEDPAFVDLTMRCNNFEQTNPIPNGQEHIGLRLGEGLRLTGPIGNSGLNNSPNPSGNVWPVDPIASSTPWPAPNPSLLPVATILAGWVSPANWVSLRNDNTNPLAILEYWAFDNEYVRPLSDNTATNFVSRRESPPLIMVYPEGDPEPTTPGIDFVQLCSPNLPDVFPLPPLRPALPYANDATATLAQIGNQTGQVALGDAVPNPAGTTTRIPVFVPAGHQRSVWLQVFDLTGRAVRWQTELKQTGSQWVEVSLSEFQPGVYGYALTDNGKTVGNRKLVVIR